MFEDLSGIPVNRVDTVIDVNSRGMAPTIRMMSSSRHRSG